MCDHKHCKPKEGDPINNPSWYTEGGIQPLDYIEANNLGHHEASIIQYLTRAGRKGPRLDDLLKAEFYIKRLIEREKRRELAAHEQRVVYAALELDETGKPLHPCGPVEFSPEQQARVQEMIDETYKRAYAKAGKNMVSEGEVERIRGELGRLREDRKAAAILRAVSRHNVVDAGEVTELIQPYVEEDDSGDLFVHGPSGGTPMAIDDYVDRWLSGRPHHLKASKPLNLSDPNIWRNMSKEDFDKLLADFKPFKPCGTDRNKDEEADRVAVEQGLRPADKGHVITVDKKTVYIPSHPYFDYIRISVKDIKLAANVPLAYNLSQVINAALVGLGDDDVLELKGGEEFIGQPKVGAGN